MKIAKVIMENVKGVSKIQDLTGLDVFVGNNGAGKSALLSALTIAMQGHDPQLGKKLSNTLERASGALMTTGFVTDSGFEAQRVFDVNKSVQKVSVAPNTGEKTNSACDARIAAEVGNFPMMWDLSEFIGMSVDKKRDFIFGLGGSDISKWTKKRVQDIIAKDEKLEGEFISSAFEVWKDGQDAQTALQGMVAYLKDKLSYWTGKEKDGQAAQRRLVEMQSQAGEDTSQPIDALKKEIEAITQKGSDLNVEKARSEERIKALNDRDDRIKELVAGMGNIALPEGMDEIMSSSDYGKEIHDLEGSIGGAEKEATLMRTALADLRVEANTLSATIESLAIHQVNGGCPLVKEIECKHDFLPLLKSLREQHAAVGVKGRKKKQLFDEQDKQIMTFKADLEAARGMKELAVKVETMASNNDRSKQEINKLKEKTDSSEGFADPEAIEKQLAGLRVQLKEKQDVLEVKNKLKEQMTIANAAAIDKVVADDNVIDIKAAIKAFGPQGVQGRIVQEFVAPLEEVVSDLLLDVSPDYAFQLSLDSDEGKPIFEMNCLVKEGWVPFRSLSAGQSVIFSAAFATAIVGLKNPACKVLCIEAGECDKESISNLLKGLTAFKDKLDNIIVCAWADMPVPKGWTKRTV